VNPHYKINDNVGNGNNNLVLTNVNIDDDTKLTNNLRTKRMIELGVGRAGGYSGYDDYELDELGVISGSSIGGGGGYGSSRSQECSILLVLLLRGNETTMDNDESSSSSS
jgi:U4/U6.U5 tri-snRNP-associated protein 1